MLRQAPGSAGLDHPALAAFFFAAAFFFGAALFFGAAFLAGVFLAAAFFGAGAFFDFFFAVVLRVAMHAEYRG